MTESEWTHSADPVAMLRFLNDPHAINGRPWSEWCPTDRKLRLFACACCRAVWPLLTDPGIRTAVEVAERYADGEVTKDALDAAWLSSPGWSLASITSNSCDAGYFAAEHIINQGDKPITPVIPVTVQANLLHEIFGNPWSIGRLVEAWRQELYQHWFTPTIIRLAESIYVARDWSALPVLADAMEEAGCTDGELLGHLRGDGPHVRGCWALDLMLSPEPTVFS